MTVHNKKETPSRESIEKLYVRESLSLRETAARLGVSITPLQRWMRELGIPIRTKSEGRFVAKKHVYSEETLERMRERAAAMRAKVTAEALERANAKKRGRPAHNRGKPWSPEQRAKMDVLWQDEERRRQFSEARMGEKSTLWKGGVKSELNRRLDHAFWRRRRLEVYERDGWVCQDCGIKCRSSAAAKSNGKTKIQAHHIVSRRDGGSDDLDNLITLCMSCHHKRELNLIPR